MLTFHGFEPVWHRRSPRTFLVEHSIRQGATGFASAASRGECTDPSACRALGQDIAKRATFWDLLFSGMSMRRDESLVSFLLGMVIKFAFNLTFGLLFMLVAFLFSLGGIVWSFGPGVLNGSLFFIVAALGATAVVTGIITLRTSWIGCWRRGAWPVVRAVQRTCAHSVCVCVCVCVASIWWPGWRPVRGGKGGWQ